jgi:hypothetical protein
VDEPGEDQTPAHPAGLSGGGGETRSRFEPGDPRGCVF